ncbi:hypothetical protein TVAG_352710 [Trichomonas vaginalis G3]|uniref:Uncharacterized protein n=1 Tax=Trichomonas vaginalis (strain ATCC PRA-98 / G3) TaxID=412133 RepID=A2EG73_TRIV3|nr:hypothetical protein TVAGG3_0133860 [Trichomonas vaginalis G3]EAY08349.1 hypothetical protein TVAG_352710 [Trichomonas vaginalis G3]KAI5546262.1 hypothetical protein TVAGG3_0133860 [Trichomonas vaginalis G3]|eukprot:XP_001320572.1 hypothetical protein [Trichomonas vaginalis G3]
MVFYCDDNYKVSANIAHRFRKNFHENNQDQITSQKKRKNEIVETVLSVLMSKNENERSYYLECLAALEPDLDDDSTIEKLKKIKRRLFNKPLDESDIQRFEEIKETGADEIQNCPELQNYIDFISLVLLAKKKEQGHTHEENYRKSYLNIVSEEDDDEFLNELLNFKL